MGRGGRGGGRRGRGGGRGGRGGKPNLFVEDKSNADFEEYYKAQGIVPEEEWDAFLACLRSPLPVTFRINGSGPFADHLREKFEKDFLSYFSSDVVTVDGEPVQAPRPLPWYPNNYAWHMYFSRNQLRKVPILEALHEFMKKANDNGSISRQEAVSMVPPLFLDVHPHHKVLDMCAAPGSKTFQLLEAVHGSTGAPTPAPLPVLADQSAQATDPATPHVANGTSSKEDSATASEVPAIKPEAVSPGAAAAAAEAAAAAIAGAGAGPGVGGGPGAPHALGLSGVQLLPTGFVVANDADYQRCQLLTHQLKRMCSPCLLVANHSAEFFPFVKSGPNQQQPLRFDRILCDVPCSGDGTMRKAPDIWRRWSVTSGNGLHIMQLRIAMHGCRMLQVGGLLVYSTCTFNPIEDEAVVSELLLRCGPALELCDMSHALPALRRLPGRTSWQVRDKGGWYASWEEAVAAGARLEPSLFPSPAKASLPLQRCMRFLPHHQDTGGFFVAVLRLVAELPSSLELPSSQRPPALPPIPTHTSSQAPATAATRPALRVAAISKPVGDPLAMAKAAAEAGVAAAEATLAAFEAGQPAAIVAAAADQAFAAQEAAYHAGAAQCGSKRKAQAAGGDAQAQRSKAAAAAGEAATGKGAGGAAESTGQGVGAAAAGQGVGAAAGVRVEEEGVVLDVTKQELVKQVEEAKEVAAKGVVEGEESDIQGGEEVKLEVGRDQGPGAGAGDAMDLDPVQVAVAEADAAQLQPMVQEAVGPPAGPCGEVEGEGPGLQEVAAASTAGAEKSKEGAQQEGQEEGCKAKEPPRPSKPHSWVRGGGGRNRSGGKHVAIDPVVPVEEEEVLQQLSSYYGLDANFPLRQQLVARSIEVARPKRLYLVSRQIMDLLLGDTQEALKIVATGHKVFERQDMRENDDTHGQLLCSYRITQEGLPFVLPHLTHQRITLGLAPFMALLKDRVLFLPGSKVAAEAGAKAAAATSTPQEGQAPVGSELLDATAALASGAAAAAADAGQVNGAGCEAEAAAAPSSGAIEAKAGKAGGGRRQVLREERALGELAAARHGCVVCCLDPAVSLELGLTSEAAAAGGLLAAAPMALSAWKGKASLAIMADKAETTQMADKLVTALKQLGWAIPGNA